MDWLQFISAIVGSIAWPTVTIVLLVLLRKHVGVLAERLEEFSFGSAKVRFVQKLLEGRAIIEQETAPTVQTPQPELGSEKPTRIGRASVRDNAAPSGPVVRSIDEDDPLAELARLIGQDARQGASVFRNQIREAFYRIERQLIEIAIFLGIPTTNLPRVLESLRERANLPSQAVDLYKTLKQARDAIVHSRIDVGNLETEEFVKQTNYMLGTLGAVLQRLKIEKEFAEKK